MDHVRALELSTLAEEQIKCARDYMEARKKAGKAKGELDILLVASLKSIRERKSNVGYDMAKLMLCEDNETARGLYKEEITQTARYKGLEKIMEALQSRISLDQSVMKYISHGERFGA